MRLAVLTNAVRRVFHLGVQRVSSGVPRRPMGRATRAARIDPAHCFLCGWSLGEGRPDARFDGHPLCRSCAIEMYE